MHNLEFLNSYVNKKNQIHVYNKKESTEGKLST